MRRRNPNSVGGGAFRHALAFHVPMCGRVTMAAGVVTYVAVVVAGCRKSEWRVSAGAREKLSVVLTTINTDIAESCKDERFFTRFRSDVAKAKQQLQELKAVGSGNTADRSVTLLAAEMLRYVHTRCTVIRIVDAEPNPQLGLDLETKQKACADELSPWLEGRANPFHLKQPCLQGAESRGPLLPIGIAARLPHLDTVLATGPS